MKDPITISPQDALQLPLHDASLIQLAIEPATDGFLTASLRVKINSEELVHPLRELGIRSYELCLTFINCWQVKTDFLGYATKPEVIATFEIEEESGLKQKLRSFGGGSTTMIHFRIQGSAGSQLDFVAEAVSITEQA